MNFDFEPKMILSRKSSSHTHWSSMRISLAFTRTSFRILPSGTTDLSSPIRSRELDRADTSVCTTIQNIQLGKNRSRFSCRKATYISRSHQTGSEDFTVCLDCSLDGQYTGICGGTSYNNLTLAWSGTNRHFKNKNWWWWYYYRRQENFIND